MALVLFPAAFSTFTGQQVCGRPVVGQEESPLIATSELFRTACLDCHQSGSDTIDLGSLPSAVGSAKEIERWEVVFDKIRSGEMPPPEEPRPNPQLVQKTVGSLEESLHAASMRKQNRLGRVVSRRLTKLELKYTLEDLLHLETDRSALSNADLVASVPDETQAEGFDNVGSAQRISSIHIAAYLEVSDLALDRALRLASQPPEAGPFRLNFRSLDSFHDRPFDQGGGVSRPTLFSRGVILFADVDYLAKFPKRVKEAGVYRLAAKVTSVQARERMTAMMIVKAAKGDLRIVKAVDLAPDETQFLSVDVFLTPGATPYLTIDLGGLEAYSGLIAAGGARHYTGPGLAITYQAIEGPIFGDWPPESTGYLMKESHRVAPDGSRLVEPALDQQAGLSRTVGSTLQSRLGSALQRLAPRVFRRQVADEEVARFASLALGREGSADNDLPKAIRTAMRSMMSAPQFLFFQEQPGELDSYALANRLSYFLWRSMPDDRLFELARSNQLLQPGVLKEQVRRMLEDPRSQRFVEDFAGQWLRLYKVNATRPDLSLFPEFDELLAHAIPRETEHFLLELLQKNLRVANLIDSDFTYLNRRLAEHYGITDVAGLEMRRYELPPASLRGGLLTQAAILKTTANGTSTSPVVRGNFVLSNILGTPPQSPPLNVTAIEPDTRGMKTVRQVLAAHRSDVSCNRCHREIDPPGFALESFDPTGGYRQQYRIAGPRADFGEFSIPGPPQLGAPVDSTGTTSDGRIFADIAEFKILLLDHQEQVARHFVRQLVVFATGGNIEFADRAEIEKILAATRPGGFRSLDIVNAVVNSRMFRNK